MQIGLSSKHLHHDFLLSNQRQRKETWKKIGHRGVPWEEVDSSPCLAPAEALPDLTKSVVIQRLSLSVAGPPFLHRKPWTSAVERCHPTLVLVMPKASHMFSASSTGYSSRHLQVLLLIEMTFCTSWLPIYSEASLEMNNLARGMTNF